MIRAFRNGPGAYTARGHTRPVVPNPSEVAFRPLPMPDRNAVAGGRRPGPEAGPHPVVDRLEARRSRRVPRATITQTPTSGRRRSGMRRSGMMRPGAEWAMGPSHRVGTVPHQSAPMTSDVSAGRGNDAQPLGLVVQGRRKPCPWGWFTHSGRHRFLPSALTWSRYA